MRFWAIVHLLKIDPKKFFAPLSYLDIKKVELRDNAPTSGIYLPALNVEHRAACISQMKP
jgi:hypothetical protein